MSDTNLYIYGAGGHAEVVAATARLLGYQIAAFIEDNSARQGEIVFGAPIISATDLPEHASIICAFGNCRRRLEIGRYLQNTQHIIISIIHPQAIVSESCKIGQGVFIGAGAVVDPGVSIDDFTIVNNGAVVCHDSTLGPGCHICPGTVIAGGVKIGEQSWIGLGSRVIEKITVGQAVLVGAGAVVVNDLSDNVVAWGVPAKVKRVN